MRYPYDRLHRTSAGPNGLLGVCMGAQFAEYAIGYPLDAGVLAVDRIAPNPPHTRSAGGPYYTAHPGRKQAVTTDNTAPGTGEKHLVRQP